MLSFPSHLLSLPLPEWRIEQEGRADFLVGFGAACRYGCDGALIADYLNTASCRGRCFGQVMAGEPARQYKGPLPHLAQAPLWALHTHTAPLWALALFAATVRWCSDLQPVALLEATR